MKPAAPFRKQTAGSTASIVWFRHDLRLADNPALNAAWQKGGAVVPVFIWGPEEEGAWPPGSASRWWLHESLLRLAADLRKAGCELVIRRGRAIEELLSVARETGAQSVFWNRRYEPAIMLRDRQVKESARAAGLEAESFNGALLHEPGKIQNKSGKPFQVFTPFWKTCLALAEPDRPLPAPRKLAPAPRSPTSLLLGQLELEPKPDWAGGLRATWQPGSAGAHAELKRFLERPLSFLRRDPSPQPSPLWEGRGSDAGSGLENYGEGRNRPDLAGTSRLSPHLHFGEISPREVWHAVGRFAEARSVPASTWRHWQFLTEVGWREFAHHLLYHFPHTPERPLRSEFARFPWREEAALLRAWERGRTGYPLVDAGMRELWQTGWMHNRVRMVVASFLVKNLLLSWQSGAAWFWDTLVDADLANNTLGWQWTAGCGADAAPYFRIFNPVAQGEKFDPNGGYVRRWVPELARLPDDWIHKPWQAPAAALAAAGVELGRSYPQPVVSLGISREVALEAYKKLRSGGD